MVMATRYHTPRRPYEAITPQAYIPPASLIQHERGSEQANPSRGYACQAKGNTGAMAS